MPKPKRVKFENSTNDRTPYIKLASKEQILEHVDDDIETIEFVLDNINLYHDGYHELDEKLQGKTVTKKDVVKRVNDPEVMARYKRAVKLFNEKLKEPIVLHMQLREKVPVESPAGSGNYIPGKLSFGDGKYDRIVRSIVDTDMPDDEQIALLKGNPAKGIKKLLDSLMKSNISELFTMDQDRFLDFAEEANMSQIKSIGALDTIIDQTGIFKEKGLQSVSKGLNPNSELAKLFAGSSEEDSLTEEQISFLLEYENLLMLMSSAGQRLANYAAPSSVVLPDDDAMRAAVFVINHNLREELPENEEGTLGSKSKFKYVTASDDPADARGMYDEAAYNSGFDGKNVFKAFREHPEIIDKGYLNADFTAYIYDENGQPMPIGKNEAIIEYFKDPKSVEFKLNAYGLKMEPERNALRAKANQALKEFTEMEKALKDIYGSESNASPEFNALAKDIRAAKAYTEASCSRFMPSLEGISRNMKNVQEKAKKYIIAKQTELKGKKPNTLRGKRMEFAAKILKLREPLMEKSAANELKDMMKKEQVKLRDILNDCVKNKISPKYDNHKKEIEETLSRILAIETIRENVKKVGEHMDKGMLESFLSEKTIKAATNDIKNSAAFKAMINDICKIKNANNPVMNDNADVNPSLDGDKLLEELDDVACYEDGIFAFTNGAHRLFKNLLQRINEKGVENPEEAAAREAAKKAEHEAKMADLEKEVNEIIKQDNTERLTKTTSLEDEVNEIIKKDNEAREAKMAAKSNKNDEPARPSLH